MSSIGFVIIMIAVLRILRVGLKFAGMKVPYIVLVVCGLAFVTAVVNEWFISWTQRKEVKS